MIKSSVLLVAVIFVALVPSCIESLDSHGNAVYTRMEIIEILEGWCANKPWIVSVMKRFIGCREGSIVSKLIKNLVKFNLTLFFFTE